MRKKYINKTLFIIYIMNNQNQESTAVELLYEQLLNINKTMIQKHKLLTLRLKQIHKEHIKECKNLKKKKKVSKKKRTPSGFAKPKHITNTLCDFLGINHGEMIARTDVTKRITQYIKKNNLQVPENKRQFIPDEKLQSILAPLDSKHKDKNGKTDSEKGYTYFNLQKYISEQFSKA